MIRVAQERRGENNRLRQFTRPSVAAQLLGIENRRRVIARPYHEPRERQDGVVLRRQRAAVTQDVIFVAADGFAGDFIGPGAFAANRFVRAVKINHQVPCRGVAQRFVIPIDPAHVRFRLEINFHPGRAHGDRVVENVGAPRGVGNFVAVDPKPDFHALRFCIIANFFEASPVILAVVLPISPAFVNEVIIEAELFRPVHPLMLLGINRPAAGPPLPRGATGLNPFGLGQLRRCGRTEVADEIAVHQRVEIVGQQSDSPRLNHGIVSRPASLVGMKIRAQRMVRLDLHSEIAEIQKIRLRHQRVAAARQVERHG